MAGLEIVTYPDPILLSESRSVPRVTRRVRRLARDMLETMHAASGVGLAAPQVGVRQRVIVVDVEENPITLVNPEITAADGEQVGLEGCLSLPDLVGEVRRAEWVVVKKRSSTSEEGTDAQSCGHLAFAPVGKKVITVVYVDEARCTGCGLCTDVCPTGAISVVDGVAWVEQSLCQECEACLSACPDGALLALREPAGAEKPVSARAPVPSPIPIRPVAPAPRPSGGVWPWLGAALGFVGREVVPHVAAFLGNRGQRQPGPALSSRAAGLPGHANYGRWGGDRRARRRRRGRW